MDLETYRNMMNNKQFRDQIVSVEPASNTSLKTPNNHASGKPSIKSMQSDVNSKSSKLTGEF